MRPNRSTCGTALEQLHRHRQQGIWYAGVLADRAAPPGVAVADLAPIDVVVIFHNHDDHLDRQSVLHIAQRAEAAGTQTQFLVPLGMRSWFIEL